MVDTREGEVAEADLPYAFDKQHPAKKIAVVAAGPLTNLVLAFFAIRPELFFRCHGVKTVCRYSGALQHRSEGRFPCRG